MNYPLISEYIEAIKSAEDNLSSLSNLRPVLDDDGNPIMSSGNFAVVFKMTDENDKLFALKCFIKEQPGRNEAYRLIAEELEFINSTYLTPIQYLDNELFVDTTQTDETEFPVLMMDWVEGQTLDKYIRKNIDYEYELSLLAYQFSRMAIWLISQPFAHGDLKPDNILVRNDGSLVLVDYDGMFVPAMKGQKARELGSPDFRHPLRTESDFDEHIDDLAIISILLSIKALSINGELLEQRGATDRLLFSETDYRNIDKCEVLRNIYPSSDSELNTLVSLFTIVVTQKDLSGVSVRLINLNKPQNYSTTVSKREMTTAWTDEYGVMYSRDKKRLLRIPDHITEYSIKEGTFIICEGVFGSQKGSGLHSQCKIQSIKLPSSILIIGDNTFYGCPELKKIEVSESNTIFDSRENCNAIIETNTNTLRFGCQKTIIPTSVTTIADTAFVACINLTSIIIPDGVETIEDYAFLNCDNLKKIFIPKSVKHIGEKVFNGGGIEYVEVDVRNHFYDSRNECNAIISTRDNKLIFGCKNTIIPDSVCIIGNSAFECSEVSDIVIPNSVNTIGEMAFYHCDNLFSIVIPKSVKRIQESAFEFSSLNSVTIENSHCIVSYDAFMYTDWEKNKEELTEEERQRLKEQLIKKLQKH